MAGASGTLGLFRALIPAFCGVSNARVSTFLEAAARRLTPAAWGAVYPDAVVYLAAHLLSRAPSTEDDGGGGSTDAEGGGPVVSKKAGDLSVTYGSSSAAQGATSATDADLAETHWGRQFLALRDTRAAGTPAFYGVI